jgi:predicted ribosome quality control (RQC) complex YloA/Tae2 family protein|tara:strand:+ start:2630 stop:2821 length:192 start_codon:yes stop_codon:yes gene_type:complete
MPNQWMDEIVKLYDQYYDDKLTNIQLLNKVEQVMAQYNIEFKKYDDSVTAQMNEYQNMEKVNG